MIVDRRTYDIRFGHHNRAVELVKAELAAAQEAGSLDTYRVYVSQFGHFSQVAVEFEFETMADQQAFWAGWQPKNPGFVDEWFDELNRGEIDISIWYLV